MNFWDFRVFVFGYRAQNENSEITQNLYFLVYNTPMHVDLCFDHCFNCLSVKTDINKNGLNLVYSEGSKAVKTQIAAACLAMWLNHCTFDVIWTTFLGFLKLRTHISVFWDGFPWFPSFRFWVYGSKRKPGNYGKSLFLGYKAEMLVDLFHDHYFNFLIVKNDIRNDELNKSREVRSS